MNRDELKHVNQSTIFSFETDDQDDFLYFDIRDENILLAFSPERTEQIFIGIDHQFMKAVNDCSEWRLYNIVYDRNDCFSIEKQCQRVSSVLSAVGLLKRIVSYNTSNKISFLFKNHEQIQTEGMRTIANLCASNININLTTFTEKDLQLFPLQLKQTFEKVLSRDQTEEHIVIKLVSVPLIDRKLVIQCMVDALQEIEMTMMREKKINILMRKKVSNSIYAICDIHHYEPAEQLMEYDHKSIMDYMTDAWNEKSLMLSI